MSGSVGMARQAGDSLETIDQRAQQTVEVVHGIADSTREQSTASQEIARLVENIAQAAEGSNSRALHNSERAQKSATARCRSARSVGSLYHLIASQAAKIAVFPTRRPVGRRFYCDPCPTSNSPMPALPTAMCRSRSRRFLLDPGERVALIGRNGTGKFAACRDGCRHRARASG
jgi:ABC-type multidrug transport system fused ATPase/permease subunit